MLPHRDLLLSSKFHTPRMSLFIRGEPTKSTTICNNMTSYDLRFYCKFALVKKSIRVKHKTKCVKKAVERFGIEICWCRVDAATEIKQCRYLLLVP